MPDDTARWRPKVLACAGLGAWLVATVASQHPNRLFDRFRPYDATGLVIPNWRLFAPEPVKHDFHVLHRLLTADGEHTPWRETTRIAPRAWHHTVWFPERRREKAMFDVCKELTTLMALPSLDLASTAPFQLLRDFVALEARREAVGGPPARGFQFAIVRNTGHDQTHDPDYLLASPYISLADSR